MSEGKSPSKGDPTTAEDLAFLRIMEGFRTLRFAIIGGVVSFGMYLIYKGFLAFNATPPWVVVVLALVAALAGPSGIIKALIRRSDRAIAKQHKRVVELESKLMPGRSSSKRPKLRDNEAGGEANTGGTK